MKTPSKYLKKPEPDRDAMMMDWGVTRQRRQQVEMSTLAKVAELVR